MLIIIIVFASAMSAGETSVVSARNVVRDTINGVPCCVYEGVNGLMDEGMNGLMGEGISGKKYPVLYLQHGMWGNEDDWTQKGRLVESLDSLIRAGEAPEMVVIMPDNCPGRPTSEEERANATTGEWEAQFGEFMREAEAKYPISNEPSQRAIAGLSMGGYHTMMVASTYDGQFAYVGMFSAATFVHRKPSKAKVFWLGIGTEDFLFEPFQQYRHWLDEQHTEYTYYESTGGHDWPNWQEYIKRFLVKIFR